MLVSQSGVFNVTMAAADTLTIRDVATAPGANSEGHRTLAFTNLCGDNLNIQLQEYVLGVWINLDAAFTLEKNGLAGYIKIQNVMSLNQLRVRASGSNATQGLKIDYMRNYETSTATWVAPFI